MKTFLRPKGLLILPALILLIAGFFSGCDRHANPSGLPADAAQVTERFIEMYYRQAQLDQALTLASGLARAKIEEEKNLGGGKPTQESTSGRIVHFTYQLATADAQDSGRWIVLLDLTIENKPMPVMARLVRLTVAKDSPGETWKIANFVESTP